MKTELEIALLHNKLDSLREREILKLIDIIQRLEPVLEWGLLIAINS